MKKIFILVIGLAIIFSGCKKLKKTSVYSNSIDTLLAQKESQIKQDSIDLAYLRMVKSQQGLTIDSLKALLEENETYGCDKFFMIVGSFQNPEYADKWSQKITTMGYSTQIIPGVDGYNMVSAQGYNNFRNAVGDIQNFRMEVVDNAWVYVRK